MKKLKFKLKRHTLNQIYVSHLRPILEYASIVWDNCTDYEKDNLEKIQYEAARIVTGLTRSVSVDKLIKEIGWVSLSDRRKIQKLTLVYKNIHGYLPNYLEELFPPNINDTNRYNLRNSQDFVTIARRTEIYSKSVIPSSIKLWNELDTNIQDSETLSLFKNKINKLYENRQVPTFFQNRRANPVNIPCKIKE